MPKKSKPYEMLNVKINPEIIEALKKEHIDISKTFELFLYSIADVKPCRCENCGNIHLRPRFNQLPTT